MISDLSLFKVYGAMARHAAEVQRVSAANISRAGDPGYKAKVVEPFETYVARARIDSGGPGSEEPFRTLVSDGPAAPNGNTVNVEAEVFSGAEAKGRHDLALTVYTKSLDLMRTALGRR